MFKRWLAMFPAAALILAQTAPEPASLSGTVTNSVTGEPIVRAHATVSCTSEAHHDRQQTFGALTNEKGPVADATAVLARSEDLTNPLLARSKPDGSYKLRVPPGNYKVAAVEEDAMAFGFQWLDPEDYEMEAVELSAGDKITKDLAQRK